MYLDTGTIIATMIALTVSSTLVAYANARLIIWLADRYDELRK